MNMKGLYVIASIVLLSVMPFGLAAQEGRGLNWYTTDSVSRFQALMIL